MSGPLSVPVGPVLARTPYGPGDVVTGARATLEAHLPAWAATYGLPPLESTTAVPSMEALRTATLPAATLTCPGLSRTPTRRARGWEGTYRLGVGVYVREDGYDAVQDSAARWLLAVRSCLLAHPSLGLPRGVVMALDLVGEDVSVSPNPSTSRTLGGCAVAFDVTLANLAPTGAVPTAGPEQPAPDLPRVKTLSPTVRVVGPTDPLEGSP